MKVVNLNDAQQHIEEIASWYYTEWGIKAGISLTESIEKVKNFLDLNDKPRLLILEKDNVPIASAYICRYEMNIYSDKEYWLGGVYVIDTQRKNRLGETIVKAVIEEASKLGIDKLHLQTEDLTGGLYSRLGWEPHEKVNYKGVDVVVMSRELL